MKNYYQLLEVAESASSAEIKKAYRRLAVVHHPDRNGGNTEAEEKFKEINAAYQVLFDPSKRAAYDLSLVAGLPFANEIEEETTAPKPPPPVYRPETVYPLNETDARKVIKWSVALFSVMFISLIIGYSAIKYYSAVIFTNQAQEAYEKGNFPDAFRLAGQALKKDAEYAPAHYLAGQIQLHQIGHLQQAVNYFTTAIALTDTLNTDMHTHRAEAYFMMAQPHRCLPDLQKALNADPFNSKANYLMGMLQMKYYSNNMKAILCFKISEQDPQYLIPSLIKKGAAYQNIGEYDSGLIALDEARKAEPQNGEVFYYLAMHQLHHQKDTANACKTFLHSYDLKWKGSAEMINKVCKRW